MRTIKQKPLNYPAMWAKIIADTEGEVGGHHRHNQMVDLLGKWNTLPIETIERGTALCMAEKRTGRMVGHSNYRGCAPRMRLFDFDLGICLECGILNSSKGHYIQTIFLLDYRGDQPVTTKLFDYDREADTLHAFDANVMSELNRALDNQ